MSARDRLEEARQAEREARSNWFRSLDIAQARLAPGAIAGDAVDRIRDGTSQAVQKVTGEVRKRPGTLIAAGAALTLFLFRKPIASAVRAKFSKSNETGNDFRSLPEKNISEPADSEDAAPVTIVTEEV